MITQLFGSIFVVIGWILTDFDKWSGFECDDELCLYHMILALDMLQGLLMVYILHIKLYLI